MRRVAESGIGAALRGGLEGQKVTRPGRTRDRHPDLDAAAIDLDLAEELVLLGFGCGHARAAGRDPDGIRLEPELALIHVITVGDLPAHPNGVRAVGLARNAEGLIRHQELVLRRRERQHSGDEQPGQGGGQKPSRGGCPAPRPMSRTLLFGGGVVDGGLAPLDGGPDPGAQLLWSVHVVTQLR